MPFSMWTRRELLAQAGRAGAGALLPMPSGSRFFAAEPTVHTPYGALRGESLPGCSVFRGVPFAAAPVRFRPPQPPAPWKGVREALRFAPAAMQPGTATGESSEDCLYLNVWAPTSPGPHPVLLWVHGGGFTGGRSSDPLQDGAVFARRDIVTVTVAYRLGVLGFLDAGPLLGPVYAGSANNALRDLLAALTWVQRSAAAFGGDPGRVTVAGQSAGAKLIGILLGTPLAAPLFQQAICESGGAERVATQAAGAEVARAFGAAWSAASGSPTSALLTAPATALIEAQKQLMEQWPLHFPLRPQLDPEFLPVLPVEAVAAGSARQKPVLLGTNRDESAFFVGASPGPVTQRELGNTSLGKFNQVAAYYERAFPQKTPAQLRIRELTAEEYWVPTMHLLQAQVAAGGRGYLYRFDYAEDTGHLPGLAYHSAELPLLWGKAGPGASALSEAIQSAWAGFVHTGIPGGPGLPAWPPYTEDTGNTMILDRTSHLLQNFAGRELGWWNGVV